MSALEPCKSSSPHARIPKRELVEQIAMEEAQKAGLDPVTVLGASPREDLYAVRQRAWLRLLDETGCSILGLATVWGCDRKSIQRTLKAMA
jgi:hypothetical protein